MAVSSIYSGFQEIGQTETNLSHQGGVRTLLTDLKRLLIGQPLKSHELGEQKLNKKKALPILSSDALSSVAYGPEQILIV
ncbi:hypothetical protein D3C86_2088100 [compost metagenome]